MVNWTKDKKLIDKRIEQSGIETVFKKIKNKMTRQSTILKENDPNRSYEFIDYLVKREAVRGIITNDLIWLAKWLTDPLNRNRIEEVHEIAWKFLNIGPKALPPAYKRVGFFSYNPKIINHVTNMGDKIKIDLTPQLIMIPRGLSKTVLFHDMGLVQEVLKDPKSKWLMTHGYKEKAKDNLKMLKELIMNPFLAAIAPDLFATERKEYYDRGGQIRNDRIDITMKDIDDDNQDIRRETTFTTGAPTVDKTGYHFDGQYDDDLVTSDTSKSPEATEKLFDFYQNSFALAERPGVYPRRLTGTEWYENSLYHIIRDRITAFVMPGEYTYKRKKVYLSNFYTEEIVNGMKNQYPDWFNSHFGMQPRPLGAEVSLVSDESFIFSYSSEKKSNKINIYDVNNLKNNSCVVVSFDPSYSRKNKKLGDNKSKAAITAACIYDSSLFIIDEWQDTGGEFGELYMALRNMAIKHNADVIICDAQGPQMANVGEWERMLYKEGWVGRFIQHKKADFDTKGKAEMAMQVLSDYFKGERIKVHFSCTAVIDEIRRITRGYDFLDTIIQICLDLNFDVSYELYKRKKNRPKISRKRIKQKNYFKIAGY